MEALDEKCLARVLGEIREGVLAMLDWCNDAPPQAAPRVAPEQIDILTEFASTVRDAIVAREGGALKLPPVVLTIDEAGALSFSWKQAA